MVVIEYIWATLSTLEIGLWGFEYEGHTPRVLLRSLKGTLARANRWRRRLSWYMNELEASLQNLSIPLERTPIDPNCVKENKRTDQDNGEDFLLVFRRLRACKELLDSFMTVVTGVLIVIQGELSLENNELSLQDNELVSTLTFLGLVFVPLCCSFVITGFGSYYGVGTCFVVSVCRGSTGGNENCTARDEDFRS